MERGREGGREGDNVSSRRLWEDSYLTMNDIGQIFE